MSFPFLMGTRKLSKPFQVGGGKCGLSASARNPNKAKGGDGALPIVAMKDLRTMDDCGQKSVAGCSVYKFGASNRDEPLASLTYI